MCAVLAGGQGLRGQTQARIPGGRLVAAGWPSLSSAPSSNTARGKESCFEVKLLKHHLRDLTSVQIPQRTGQGTRGRALQPWPLSQQPTHRRLPTRTASRTRGHPRSLPQMDALSKGGAQGAEAGGRCIYLTLLNIVACVVFLFFFNSLQTETVKS